MCSTRRSAQVSRCVRCGPMTREAPSGRPRSFHQATVTGLPVCQLLVAASASF
ncbi:hypothetical protein JOH51_005212 [Rhizobium leguminosarum]|nr:hypothetical protein [Rhizobium leguminosarum]